MVAMTKPVKWLFPLAGCSVLFLRTAAWGQDDTVQSLRILAAAQHDNQLQQHNQEQGHQEQHQEHHEKHDVDTSGQNQQEMEHTHHHGEIPVVTPETPHLGRTQERATGALYRLDELERIALASNPTLAQAAAEISSAKGRRLQSGLYPNPKVGYEGEEIRGGAYGGGEQGFLVEQVFVTAGKLGLNRKMGDAEIRRAEAEAEAQRFRVLNGVRIAYYRVLAAQEMLDAKADLQRISRNSSRSRASSTTSARQTIPRFYRQRSKPRIRTLQ
jgi:Outer membrane efflux protein